MLVPMQSQPYTLRTSTRARAVRMTVSGEHGLIVTVPVRYRLSRLPAVLAAHEAWITRALARVAVERAGRAEEPAVPATIHLRALEEAWSVRRDATAARTVSAKELPGNVLLLRGKTADSAACARALQRWLQRRAERRLPPLLRELESETGFRASDIRIRGQRTIWGSCAHDGTISLNRNLLFFPPEIARLVLVHELCHLHYRSHGPRFWGLVARFTEDLPTLRRTLKSARRFLPSWTSVRAGDADPLQ